MQETLSVLDQKEQELIQQLEEIRTTRTTLIKILGSPETPQVRQVEVTTTERLSHEENGNLKFAFDAILPVIEKHNGATFKTIHREAVPVRSNKKQYAKTTIKAYVSALHAAGFITKKGPKYYIK